MYRFLLAILMLMPIGAPAALGQIPGGSVSTFSAGTTGFTPSSPSSGTVVLSGTLAATNGGTGITSLGTGVPAALGINGGSSGSFAIATGTLTSGDILIANASGTGVLDSGLVPKSTFTNAQAVWGNNGAAGSAPQELTVLTLGSGTCSSAPTYSFISDTTAGMARVTTDSTSLCGKSTEIVRATGVASGLPIQIVNAAEGGTALIRPINGTNISITLDSLGTGTIALRPNGVTQLNYGVSHTSAWTFSSLAFHNGGVILGNTGFNAMVAGELGFNKITASSTAPGAAGGKIEMVCGTNAGSLKLIAFGGTSNTPVTILDNIGSGATGC